MAQNVRETYDLPKRPPVAMRQWIAMLAFVALALVLWVILPDKPIVVALLAVFLLAAVFFLVWRVLSSRELDREPGRNPTTPPSARQD